MVKKDVTRGIVTSCSSMIGHVSVGLRNMIMRQMAVEKLPIGMTAWRPKVSDSFPKICGKHKQELGCGSRYSAISEHKSQLGGPRRSHQTG